MRDFTAQRIAIDGQPIGHGSDLGQLKIAEDQLTRLWLVFNGDLIARLHVIGSNINAAPVHEDVPMRNELAGGTARICQAQPENHIVDPRLKKLEKCLASDAALAQCVLENAPELALEQSVLITELLLFSERNRIIGLFAPGTFRAVHTGRIIFSLQGLGRSKNWNAVTAADFSFWSGVSTHAVL